MTTIPDAWPNCAVSLARYQQIIGVDECAFWGVAYTGQSEFECSQFWSEWQRQSVADALAQAQQMIEDIVNYPLCPTWITGAYDSAEDPRYIDQQWAIDNPVVTRWVKIIQAGIQATSTIQAGAVVSYADADESVVGPIATTVTDTNEVKVFYPGSERIITPKRMTISGGNLTIYIPRCRLVDAELLDNTGDPNVGLEKTTVSNFLTTVDVKRVYNDPSTHAYLVREHSCNTLCSAEGCATATDAACIVIRDPLMGIIDIHPGSYSNGWSQVSTSYCYNHLRLNYQAGLRAINRTVENVVVRLAHALMPEEPCSCTVTQRLWMRDRMKPDVLTREILNCPWGYLAGSYFAYSWASTNAIVRGGGLA